MLEDFEVCAGMRSHVNGAEVYYRGYDSGFMRFNIFENNDKKVIYLKIGGELLLNGDCWVCIDFYEPTEEIVPIGKKVARFVKKQTR